MVTTPLSQGQHLQLQQWQRCQCIDGNNTIATRATMPAQQQATRATTLAQQRQRRLCIDNGDNAIVTRITITIMTMATRPAH
jgi:hypothetical protein